MQVSQSCLQPNGGLQAAFGCQVRGESAKRLLRLRYKDGGGFQTEAQILLHESLREVQSQGSETMETDDTNIKNCNHYYPGNPLVTCECVQRSGATCFFYLWDFLSPPVSKQLVSFGLSNEMMVTFKDENLMTFRNLFLKGYKDHRHGSLSLYTKRDVNEHIHYIINRVLKPLFNHVASSI